MIPAGSIDSALPILALIAGACLGIWLAVRRDEP